MEARQKLLAALTFFVAPGGLLAQPLPPPPPGVQVSNTYGIEFATVGAPGNVPHAGIGGSIPNPRLVGTSFGSVAVPYRMARTEVTTAQWLEFVNTFSIQTSFPTELWGLPSFTQETPPFWGAQVDPTYAGPGTRYRVIPSIPTSANIPVSGVSWRDAVLYANWLNNGRSLDPSSLWNGAYDTSTFGAIGGAATDQITHNTNARFWIPSYDEWAKAMFFDPARPTADGYWSFSTASDSPPVYGPPPTGMANAGFTTGTLSELAIPVASYPTAQSPWGLLDGAGSRTEWTESISPLVSGARRYLAGSAAGSNNVPDLDMIGHVGTAAPDGRLADVGFRLAAAVPSPGAGALTVSLGLVTVVRSRRRSPWKVHGKCSGACCS